MITISQFKNKISKQPSSVETLRGGAEFNEFVTAWHHVVNDKKDQANVFTMCEYGEQENRKKINILSVTGIVLDVDQGNRNEGIAEALNKLGPFAYYGYTTYQHTVENPRVRIVVPISKSVTADEFEGQSLALRLAAFLGLTIDPCCVSAAQCYFMPTIPTASAACEIFLGDSTTLFDIALLPAQLGKSGGRSGLQTTSSQLAIYKKVDDLIDEKLDGIDPIYVGDKFYIYDSGVWCPKDAGKVFCREIINFYGRKVGVAEVQEWIAVMKILFSSAQLPAPVTTKITLQNGTLNTETGLLEPHSAENFHTTGMAYDYDENATCPLWLKTLDDIFLNDPDKEEKILFLQEWFGYLLTPVTIHHLMVWLYGGGANGKSVITHIAKDILGKDNVTSISLSQLGMRFLGAEHDGKLANIVDEIATNSLMKEDELKKIISGDPVLVERKNKDPFVCTPTARIFAATNTLPPSKDSTHGLDRRLQILTCNRTFKPEEMDRDLLRKLVLELPGIFVWSLTGHMRLNAQGKFTEVPSSVAAMDDFKVGRNSVALFKRDCVKVLTGGKEVKQHRMASHDFYKLYKTYCLVNTYQPFSSESFGKKIKELGIEQIRSGGVRYYIVSTVDPKMIGLDNTNYSYGHFEDMSS